MNDTLVILSGGQDSTTCLFEALNRENSHQVHTLTFDYGQRHVCEVESVAHVLVIAQEFYPNRIVQSVVKRIPDVLEGTSPLTNPNFQVEQYASADVLPGGLEKTFVPCRNMLFLTLAANYAYVNNCSKIVIGVSAEDYGGYPDCRPIFIDSVSAAINDSLGIETLSILTPLMHLSKKETVELAMTLPGCVEALAYSHTCYMGGIPSAINGELIPCGKCHSCLLRQKGFQEAGVEDPLITRLINSGAMVR